MIILLQTLSHIMQRNSPVVGSTSGNYNLFLINTGMEVHTMQIVFSRMSSTEDKAFVEKASNSLSQQCLNFR